MLLHWHIVLTVLVLGLYVHAQQPQQQQTSRSSNFSSHSQFFFNFTRLSSYTVHMMHYYY
jgi:hypothetical protein